MLKKALIGFGIVFAILIGIVFALGFFTPDEKSVSQTVSMTVGSRTVTVGGHYKDMTQELLSDGMKINIDGHVITIGPDQTGRRRQDASARARPGRGDHGRRERRGGREGGELRRRNRQRSAIAPRRPR